MSHREGTVRMRALIGATAAGAAVATLMISVLPFVDFAYRSEPLHVAIESTAAIVGLLAAYLLLGRFKRSGSLHDLLLGGALLLLGGTNLCFSMLPAVAGDPGRFATWSPVAGRLLGALALAAAAFAPPRRLPQPERYIAKTIVACVVVLTVIAAVVAALGDRLPVGIDPELSPERSDRPRVVGHPALLAVQVAAMLLFAAAAVGFTRRVLRTGDELIGWIAAGSTLAAFARLNYFLFPSLYSQWVYTGDFLRLGFYLLLLAGALREIGAYQRELAGAATLAERHRVARELHDGLAQDLAFISTHARRLAARGRPAGTEALERLSLAADRSLDESRDAIAALTRPVDEPLEVSLGRAAEEVASRCGAEVVLETASDLRVSPETRDALVRIVREAIANATRHGGATTVHVSLSTATDVTLRVADDGRGFAENGGTGGFGLVSMRERAELLGGELSIEASDAAGTVVEVRLPREVLVE